MVVKVGDRVQWTVNGMDQFSAPKIVQYISSMQDEDGRTSLWCFVEGSDTGLPADQLTLVPKERFTLFYNGQFSQFHPCRFIVNKVVYNRAEQYMMASKARLFNDQRALRTIMESNDPVFQKATGRIVKNFDEGKWNSVARDFVYAGNKAKFTQNAGLLNNLFATKGTTLVEATEKDRLWGVGLHISDPKCHSRDTWQGKNWLGETLTCLRDDLLKH